MASLPSNMSPSLLFIALCCIAGLTIVRLLRIGRRRKDYPPGPPTLPIIGNLHQMPSKDIHLAFQKWALQYGDIYSVMLGSQVLVVLNSDEAVKELLDRRSSIYSSRPDIFIGQDIASGGLRVVLMKYDARWRMGRRVVHSLLNQGASRRYTPFQDLESKQMLNDLLDTPEDFLKHLRRHSNAVVTSVLYGWRNHTYEDPSLQQLFSGFEEFTELLQRPECALFDAYPVLRWLPDFMVPIKRKARELHKNERKLYLRHWARAKQDYQDNMIPPCFSVGMIELQDKEGFSDAEAAYMVGNLLEAGSDTLANTLYAFVQAMLLYPDVQLRARKEIEKVCGDERMPTIEDKASLPYVRCLMKETLRWMPATIIGGIPHSTTTDDSYKGYTIPKGASVVNNAWTINMDPRRATNPRTFDPDRYLDDHLDIFESAGHKDPTKRDHFTFGGGRRTCPGIHVVDHTLFTVMSRLLWAFDIAPVTGPDGTEILPDPEKLTQGVICRPVEYPAKMTPCNPKRAALVRAAWSQTQEKLLHPATKQWLAGKFPLK